MVIGLTGASGFLGRHVIQQAVAGGHEVIAFSRRLKAPVPGALEIRRWSSDLPPDVTGCDAIIHLAGESVLGLWTRSKRTAIRNSRVEGTRQLVAALKASSKRPVALISASAIGFYGHRGDEALIEAASPGAGFLADVTREWEAEAHRAEELGVRVACGRIGLVLGPDGGAWPLLRRIFRLGAGGRLGSGRQWMSWVHVHDVATLLLIAAVDPRYSGPVNLVSPEPVTNADFTRTVARALHRPALVPVPAFCLRAGLRDQAGLFLDSQRVLPRAAESLGYPFGFPNLEGALQDLING